MLDLFSSRGIRAVVFGLDSLLVPSAASSGPARDSALLYRRALLDPRSEPLSPLFRNKPGVVAKSSEILQAFFPQDRLNISAFYANHAGVDVLADELRKIRGMGLTTAVWDNCAAGTTSKIHTLLDQYYEGIFPRPLRLLSSRHEAQLGEDSLKNALFSALSASPEEVLCVTANPGQRDYALRLGMPAFFFEPSASALLSAVGVYLGNDGTVRDPIVYISELLKCGELAEGAPSLAALLKNIFQHQNCGSLQSDFRCLLLDRKVRSAGGLAEDLRRAGLPAPLRFKPEEDILTDSLNVIDVYLSQIERGVPALARSAMLGLMAELTAVCRLRAEGAQEAWLIRPLVEKVFDHIQGRHELYTQTAKVFHEDEWTTLSSVFNEDDDALDRRYEDWVERTQALMREMSAAGKKMKDIRRMVKERLVEDLILRMMELQMHYRCLLRDRSVPELFPRHHDAKNRAASLTVNIDDKRHWKKAMAVQTKTLQGWTRGLVMGMVRKAGEVGGRITFTHEMDAGFPSIELSDLEEKERDAVDVILTELMANAVKYRRLDEALSVRMDMIESEGAIEFRVTDNGVGIQDVRSVLEGGVREHPEAEGYGGGLASVLRHVNEHPGWALSVRTEVGRGSTFTLSVALQNKDAQKRRMTDSGFPKI